MRASERSSQSVVKTVTIQDAEPTRQKAKAETDEFFMHPLEFMFYFTVFAVAASVHLIWAVFISEAFTDAGLYAGKLDDLVQGWIPGRKLDMSNGNWYFLRKHIILLVPWFLLMAIVSRTLQWYLPAKSRLMQRMQAVLTLLFLSCVHGRSAVLTIAVAFVNYLCCKFLAGYRIAPALFWILNCSLYFAREGVEHGSGYFNWLSWFAEYRPGLRITFAWPYSLCRMISFSMDYHWAKIKRDPPCKEQENKPAMDPINPIHDHQEEGRYDFLSYFSYVFFPPLYTDGPIITYNNFIHQFHGELYSDYAKIARYMARMLLLFLVTEVSLHYNYLDSLASSGIWRSLVGAATIVQNGEPIQLGAFGMGIMMFSAMLYYFFHHLVLWRFYRSWSLLYGIDPPEDVTRCILNNYDIRGFWRYWHASINRWCVRYIYIPLGGAKYRVFNIWVVFFFIAVWHEVSFSFLKWSWLICVIFAVDSAGRASVRLPFIAPYAVKWWFRYIKAFAATVELYFIYLANLGGFVVGVKKIPVFLKTMMGDPTYAVIVFVALYSCVQMVIAVKNFEHIKGKRLCPVMI